jgi:SAM-dependent methyltransferase
MKDTTALHNLNPQDRFTSRADDYAKYRPSYPTAMIDCIVAEPTLKEFARILKPQGKLAVVWNNRNRNDEFTNEYGRLTQIVSENNSELRYGTERYLHHAHGFNPVRHFVFPYQQALSSQASEFTNL